MVRYRLTKATKKILSKNVTNALLCWFVVVGPDVVLMALSTISGRRSAC